MGGGEAAWLTAAAVRARAEAGFKVSQQRGPIVESPLAPIVTATVHPSSILPARDDAAA